MIKHLLIDYVKNVGLRTGENGGHPNQARSTTIVGTVGSFVQKSIQPTNSSMVEVTQIKNGKAYLADLKHVLFVISPGPKYLKDLIVGTNMFGLKITLFQYPKVEKTTLRTFRLYVMPVIQVNVIALKLCLIKLYF